jgi:hypothetical protein
VERTAATRSTTAAATSRPCDKDGALCQAIAVLTIRSRVTCFAFAAAAAIWLSNLAKDRAYEFFFALGPLLLKGGIGVPINPLAIL